MEAESAEALHARGREAGASGDYPAALELFTQASELAPDWPHPVYDRAFTRLMMQDFEGAAADIDRTLELSPGGFFVAHVARDALRRERAGELPRGFYLAYFRIEGLPEDQRRVVLEQIVLKFPQFARAWLDFANLADTPLERLSRLEKGLAADPDPLTADMLRLNQAFALQQLGETAAGDAILEELAGSPHTTALAADVVRVLLKR